MHTLGASLRAFASGPIGFDVEALDLEREIDSISEENFAPTEATDLEACEKGRRRQARFIELWTFKEAYLKALAVGSSDRSTKLRLNSRAPRASMRPKAVPSSSTGALVFLRHRIATAWRSRSTQIPRCDSPRESGRKNGTAPLLLQYGRRRDFELAPCPNTWLGLDQARSSKLMIRRRCV